MDKSGLYQISLNLTLVFGQIRYKSTDSGTLTYTASDRIEWPVNTDCESVHVVSEDIVDIAYLRYNELRINGVRHYGDINQIDAVFYSRVHTSVQNLTP